METIIWVLVVVAGIGIAFILLPNRTPDYGSADRRKRERRRYKPYDKQ